MKAAVCQAFGPIRDLTLTDVPPPRVGPGEVLIDVVAAGLNFLDTLIVRGLYQVRPPVPFAPGSEVTGIVRDVAADVSGIAPGQRVVAFTGHGGFAMQAVADAAMVYPIPDAMSYTDAAAFLVTYATSHHALVRRANVQQAETVLVLGAAGGVGLTAVEISKQLGASVIAAASSDEKLALCRQYGAHHLINYSCEDLRARVQEVTGGRGVNVIYDPVGGKLCETALRSLAFLGRYLVVGFAAGEVPSIAANRLLLKSAGALGVAWGAFAKQFPQQAADDVCILTQWYMDGKLRPHISAIYPLERCVEALEHLTERGARGKVVLTIEPDKFRAGGGR